jgi:predicted transposase YdaD
MHPQSVLTGLRLPAAVLASLFERVVIHMKESSAYQLILAEGEAKGKAEGEAKGKAEGEARGKAAEAKTILLRQGRKRFGEPDAATVAALQAITDVAYLESLSERLLEVASWQELLASP